MKFFMVLMVMASFFTGTVSAGQTTTECPMMREANERNNPKSGLGSAKLKIKKLRSAAIAQ